MDATCNQSQDAPQDVPEQGPDAPPQDVPQQDDVPEPAEDAWTVVFKIAPKGEAHMKLCVEFGNNSVVVAAMMVDPEGRQITEPVVLMNLPVQVLFHRSSGLTQPSLTLGPEARTNAFGTLVGFKDVCHRREDQIPAETMALIHRAGLVIVQGADGLAQYSVPLAGGRRATIDPRAALRQLLAAIKTRALRELARVGPKRCAPFDVAALRVVLVATVPWGMPHSTRVAYADQVRDVFSTSQGDADVALDVREILAPLELWAASLSDFGGIDPGVAGRFVVYVDLGQGTNGAGAFFVYTDADGVCRWRCLYYNGSHYGGHLQGSAVMGYLASAIKSFLPNDSSPVATAVRAIVDRFFGDLGFASRQDIKHHVIADATRREHDASVEPLRRFDDLFGDCGRGNAWDALVTEVSAALHGNVLYVEFLARFDTAADVTYDLEAAKDALLRSPMLGHLRTELEQARAAIERTPQWENKPCAVGLVGNGHLGFQVETTVAAALPGYERIDCGDSGTAVARGGARWPMFRTGVRYDGLLHIAMVVLDERGRERVHLLTRSAPHKLPHRLAEVPEGIFRTEGVYPDGEGRGGGYMRIELVSGPGLVHGALLPPRDTLVTSSVTARTNKCRDGLSFSMSGVITREGLILLRIHIGGDAEGQRMQCHGVADAPMGPAAASRAVEHLKRRADGDAGDAEAPRVLRLPPAAADEEGGDDDDQDAVADAAADAAALEAVEAAAGPSNRPPAGRASTRAASAADKNAAKEAAAIAAAAAAAERQGRTPRTRKQNPKK